MVNETSSLSAEKPAAPARGAILPQAAKSGGISLGTWKLIGILVVLAIACLLPFGLTNYRIFQLTLALIYAIAILGLNILTGYNGQISLGHGAFYALGAYVAAILMNSFNVPYWATIPVSGVICLIVGFLFGLPALRFDGLYLALATFALAVATPQLLKYKALATWTGGVQGINLLKPDPPSWLHVNSDQYLYFFTLAITVIMFAIAWNILRGRVGRALVAIRDHPVAAEAMGVNTSFYKAMAFGVSALYTGVAGAIAAIVIAYVAPDSFDFFLSIFLLVGLVVGGLASISGAIYGALFIQFAPNFASDLSKAAPWAIFGIFMIGAIFLMPGGAASLVQIAWRRIRRYVGSSGSVS